MEAIPVPLIKNSDDAILVSGTRIPLDTVIIAYLNGDSAEEIVENFDTLTLASVYAIISYYLDHRNEIDAYLERRQQETAVLRQKMEAQFPSKNLRKRLLARQKKHDQAGH